LALGPALSGLFFNSPVLAHCFFALVALKAIEHQHTVKVVDLVLKHARFQLVGFNLDDLAVETDAAN
jgi:hypothetical protein